jgi:hypothetical protein
MGDPGHEQDQEDVAEETRQTGGDAPSAGTVEEREAVAEDEDHLFDDEP